jgi:hypothetical protein
MISETYINSHLIHHNNNYRIRKEMKHWLEEQELLRSYPNFRGSCNNSLTYGFRDQLIEGTPL